jgi:hypothetical protein
MLLLSGAMPSDLSGGRPNLLLRGVHTLGNELIFAACSKEKIYFDLARYRFIRWQTEVDHRCQLTNHFLLLCRQRRGVHDRTILVLPDRLPIFVAEYKHVVSAFDLTGEDRVHTLELNLGAGYLDPVSHLDCEVVGLHKLGQS